jgi:uncharacterized protein
MDDHECDELIEQVLRDTGTVAIVGLSDRVDRPAWEIALFLQDIGLTVIPVHPSATVVHGERAVPAITELPADAEVDTAVLFVRPEIGAGVVDQIIGCGGINTIWMQPGATERHAADRAEAAGIRVVRDRCIKVEYQKRIPDDGS